MINYIDYYFEASKKTLKEKKPVSIARPTNTTLPLELKSEWENHWNEIKNTFLKLTGEGVWKEVENDFKSSVGKWGVASAQSTRPWRKFYELLFNKIEKNHSNTNITGWEAPNLKKLQKEVANYVLLKSITGFNTKGVIFNKNIKDTLEKIVDLNSISKTNFTEFKDRFEEQNNINVNEFPNLIVFLSHPYHTKFFDSQISKFMTGKPGKVKGQTLAEYTGYFNPSNNVTDTSIEDNPQIDISNSSINNKDPEYLKESKKLLKAFIKNVYQTTDEDIKEIIEIQAGLGNFLPPLTTITDNSSHEKLARNILYQLSFFKKDLDITEILEDFLFFYNKNVSNKISPDSHELTPQAQKELKELKNELADAIKKLKEAEETIEIIKGNALTKKISPNEKYKLSNAQIDARSLKKQISTIKDQLETYQWSDSSISNYINNINKSLPEIRFELKDLINRGRSNRKEEGIRSGKIDASKKFNREQEEKLREEKKERENKYIENWKKYGDALLDDIYPRQDIEEYWNEIFGSNEYQEMVTKLQKEISDPDVLKKVLDEIEKDIKSGFREKSEELKKDIQDLANLSIKEKRKTLRTIDPSGTLERAIEKLTATKSQQAMQIAYANPKGDTLATYQTTIKQMKTGSDFLTPEQMPKMIASIKEKSQKLSEKQSKIWLNELKQLLVSNFNNKNELRDAIIQSYNKLKKQQSNQIVNNKLSSGSGVLNPELQELMTGESTNPLIKSVLKKHILQ